MPTFGTVQNFRALCHRRFGSRDAEQEKVWDYDWLAIVPPTIEELGWPEAEEEWGGERGIGQHDA